MHSKKEANSDDLLTKLELVNRIIGYTAQSLKLAIMFRRSIATLNKKTVYDTVIIGGGVVGSSVAYHLSKIRGGKIAVVEKDFKYEFASALRSVLPYVVYK